jgi:hypothetical protein
LTSLTSTIFATNCKFHCDQSPTHVTVPEQQCTVSAVSELSVAMCWQFGLTFRKLTVEYCKIYIVYVSRQVRLYRHYVRKGKDTPNLGKGDSGELYRHCEWAGGLETIRVPKIWMVGGSKRRALCCVCVTDKDTTNAVNICWCSDCVCKGRLTDSASDSSSWQGQL